MVCRSMPQPWDGGYCQADRKSRVPRRLGQRAVLGGGFFDGVLAEQIVVPAILQPQPLNNVYRTCP